MSIAFRAAALRDLEDIFEFSFRHFGAQQAEQYRNGLHQLFALLEHNPRIGPLHDFLGRNIRSFAHKRHRIYYLVEDGDIMVVRILHHAQDVGPALDN